MRTGFVPAGVACLASLALPVFASAPVKVSLQTPERWPEAPLLTQILETLYLEDADAFFPLLEQLSVIRGTEQEVYTQSVDHIQGWSGWSQSVGHLDTFQLSLASKEASPRIQAAYEWYNTLNTSKPEECWSWVTFDDVTGACSVEELTRLRTDANAARLDSWPFDHSRSHATAPTAVLYADVLSDNFMHLLQHLEDISASDTSFNYILRWRPSLSHPSSPLQLNSYGASLYIKKSDYLAIDDRNQQGSTPVSSRTEEGEMSLQQIWADPANAPSTLKPLTRQALSELGDKATHFILAQPNPLDALVKLSQDFPKYASFLSEAQVDSDGPVYQEVQHNRLSQQQPGINAVWMNGLQLNPKQLDTYALLGLLRAERSRVDDLSRLGLTIEQAVKLLVHPAMSEAANDKATSLSDLMKLLRLPEVSLTDLGGLFDASDRQEGGEAILWFNDLEQDRRYARWPRSLRALLQPSFAGAPQQIRRNLFNIVLALDMGRTWSHTHIAEFVQPFVGRMMPFRIGLVPLMDTASTSSLEMGRLSKYIFENLSAQDAMTFSSMLSRSAQGPQTDLTAARSIYERLSSKRSARPSNSPPLLSFNEIIAQGDLSPSRAYAERLDLGPEKGHVFIDGKHVNTEGSWQKFVQATLSLHSRFLQAQVAKGALKEEADTSRFFYDQSGTFSKRSELVFPSNDYPLEIQRSFRPHCDGIWLKEGSKNDQTLSLYATDSDGTLEEPLKQLQSVHKDIRVCYSQRRATPSVINGSPSPSCSININGRILNLPSCDLVTFELLDLLANVERKQRVAPALQALGDVLDYQGHHADVVAGVTAILADAQVKDKTQKAFGDVKLDRSDPLMRFKKEHTSVTAGQSHSSWAVFQAILDPTSEGAQRTSAALRSLATLSGVSIEIVLLPKPHASELSVKRFYRDARQSQLVFEPDGSMKRPMIEFAGPPEAVLLNLELETHPSWLAFSKRTQHDLENIKLVDLPAEDRATGIDATFELERLLIEGHCRELPSGVPPRGLQLELLDQQGARKGDSLVMANMAYIQLHADRPGLYDIRIRPGRSSEVYRLTSLGLTGMDSELANVTGTKMAVMSFEGSTIYPQFERNAGMEYADVLDTSQPARPPSILSRLGSLFSSAGSNALSGPTKTQADINVFTVASGHLYERMAMIMMVSVMRHTESSVKFWFITNFLSPAFKSFLPHLAAQYGFQYELVTYQWPHWLRSQTEKQRTIWGYKVLFLDVLFPLGLDRVIFVDSDQIVRADLKELVDLDLRGAPYAYAPMGDDREEMEGFRFWKTGYWRDALRGRPYHISALYVVDLERFRQLAAGDRLRGQYQALSADPNSLANLDQDLPNNMQNMLPIYTLDQSWLWCETWCSDESLASAKTIDLCNNPLTHEPKLARARRLIPEWTVYDREIAEVAATVASQNAGGVGAAFEADASSLEQARLQEEEKQQHKEITDPGAEGHVRDEL